MKLTDSAMNAKLQSGGEAQLTMFDGLAGGSVMAETLVAFQLRGRCGLSPQKGWRKTDGLQAGEGVPLLTS